MSIYFKHYQTVRTVQGETGRYIGEKAAPGERLHLILLPDGIKKLVRHGELFAAQSDTQKQPRKQATERKGIPPAGLGEIP